MAIERAGATRTIRRKARRATGLMLDSNIGIESLSNDSAQPYRDSAMKPYEPAFWLALAVGMRGVRVSGEHTFELPPVVRIPRLR